MLRNVGRATLVVMGLSTLFLGIGAPASAAGATVSVSPSSVAHGGTIHVSGTGFIAKYTVILYIGGNNWYRAYTTQADGSGNVSDYAIVTSCDMPSGSYTLYAASYNAGNSSSQPAEAQFSVNSDQIGTCARSTGPIPPPTGVPNPSPKLVHHYVLGFNVKVKRSVIAPGQIETVVVNVHWPSVFSGRSNVIYDKHHHLVRAVRTNKKGVWTYRFRVKYRPSRNVKARVVVSLSGKVTGEKMKGVQHVQFTVRALRRSRKR